MSAMDGNKAGIGKRCRAAEALHNKEGPRCRTPAETTYTPLVSSAWLCQTLSNSIRWKRKHFHLTPHETCQCNLWKYPNQQTSCSLGHHLVQPYSIKTVVPVWMNIFSYVFFYAEGVVSVMFWTCLHHLDSRKNFFYYYYSYWNFQCWLKIQCLMKIYRLVFSVVKE